MAVAVICNLCGKESFHILSHPVEGEYFCCHYCDLRFLHPQFRISKKEEIQRYNYHTNDSEDPGYRNFMSPLFNKLLEFTTPEDIGLDYGSGKSSAIAKMLEERSYKIKLYDPLFYSDKTLLQTTYDFVICTEVIEHFAHPKEDFSNLVTSLRPQGILALMTLFYTPEIDFNTWYYRRDPTHIAFYSLKTFSYLQQEFSLEPIYTDGIRIFLFKKK